MTESTNVSLNLQSPNISTVVYAVQNDRLSRRIVAQLRDGSAAWTPPAGWSAAIRYLKPDGTGGFYDTDEGGSAAISISGSVATLTLAEQCTTVPGDVFMQLNFYTSGGDKLTTFAWIVRVQKSVLSDATIVSTDYYNTLTATIAAGIPVAQALTFPVPISNGGTGASTAAQAISNLGFESGNGYCKMPDGTLVCYGRVQFPSTEAESNSTQSVTFSPAFTTRPAVTVSPVREAEQTPYLFPVSVYAVSASGATFAFSNRYNGSVSNMYADWIAVGRWK